MKKQNTRMLVEAGMMIALAIILGEYVWLFKMPLGGTVTLGGMVPLFIFSFRWGWKKGILVGAIYGILDLILGGFYSMHPISILLDYPLAYSMIGLAGLFRKTAVGYIGGIFAGITGRFLCHVVSGVVFYASYAPKGQSPWVYSILYNGTFLLPELAITLVMTLVILKFVRLPDAEQARA
ncbi:MAG TPA: energy-coupled thiamine transporter ThiT [Clostridia bacterium]|nr:energy-coupled thiamine transporter ThiT [Clostridia bacterium]